MASEQAPVPSSLEDRISNPSSSNGINAAAPSFVPGQVDSPGSWADEVASPAAADPGAAAGPGSKAEEKAESHSEESSLSMAQTDGAGEPLGGSTLKEPDYDVEVKLSDIQADPNNPLYSIKNFEELGL